MHRETRSRVIYLQSDLAQLLEANIPDLAQAINTSGQVSGEESSGKGHSSKRMEEAKEVLRVLRQCRSRLNKLRLDHSAAYADIAVQLLKQSIATEEHEQENPKNS